MSWDTSNLKQYYFYTGKIKPSEQTPSVNEVKCSLIQCLILFWENSATMCAQLYYLFIFVTILKWDKIKVFDRLNYHRSMNYPGCLIPHKKWPVTVHFLCKCTTRSCKSTNKVKTIKFESRIFLPQNVN